MGVAATGPVETFNVTMLGYQEPQSTGVKEGSARLASRNGSKGEKCPSFAVY